MTLSLFLFEAFAVKPANFLICRQLLILLIVACVRQQLLLQYWRTSSSVRSGHSYSIVSLLVSFIWHRFYGTGFCLDWFVFSRIR